jgi:hypothetical protein
VRSSPPSAHPLPSPTPLDHRQKHHGRGHWFGTLSRPLDQGRSAG